MQNKPLHPCNKPGCGALSSERFCPKHRKAGWQDYDKARGTNTQRGYGANWKKIRDAHLREHPLCEHCMRLGIIKQADMVHHKDGNQFNNKDSNHESLCNACHEKTKHE